MQPKVVALRKRTQIATANRVMFLWVVFHRVTNAPRDYKEDYVHICGRGTRNARQRGGRDTFFAVCHCLEQAVPSRQHTPSTACSKQWHTLRGPGFFGGLTP